MKTASGRGGFFAHFSRIAKKMSRPFEGIFSRFKRLCAFSGILPPFFRESGKSSKTAGCRGKKSKSGKSKFSGFFNTSTRL